MRLASLKEELLDLLYPAECLGCGAPGACLCRGCLTALAADSGNGERIHRPRGTGAASVSEARAAGTYDGVMRDMVLRLKSSARPFAAPLGSLMAAAAGNHPDYVGADVVCFVPSERARVAERGFNPAGLLAQQVASLVGRPLCDLLEKTRSTLDQDSVSGRMRWLNVEGVFRPKRGNMGGAKVLLVDDVLTTGATVENCARALVEGGAGSVHVLVAAAASLRRGHLTQEEPAK